MAFRKQNITPTGGEFIPMLFAEMLNYNRALLSTEIAQLETCSGDKWGITLTGI